MSYDYDRLRDAIRIVRTSFTPEFVLEAAGLLADYTEATLDYSDEVETAR